MANNIYIGKSNIHGKGVMASSDMKPMQLVGLSHRDGKPVSDIGKYYNHSTTPNSVVFSQGNEKFVVTKNPISKDEEITVDYREQPDLEQPEDFLLNQSKKLISRVKDDYYNQIKNQTNDSNTSDEISENNRNQFIGGIMSNIYFNDKQKEFNNAIKENTMRRNYFADGGEPPVYRLKDDYSTQYIKGQDGWMYRNTNSRDKSYKLMDDESIGKLFSRVRGVDNTYPLSSISLDRNMDSFIRDGLLSNGDVIITKMERPKFQNGGPNEYFSDRYRELYNQLGNNMNDVFTSGIRMTGSLINGSNDLYLKKSKSTFNDENVQQEYDQMINEGQRNREMSDEERFRTFGIGGLGVAQNRGNNPIFRLAGEFDPTHPERRGNVDFTQTDEGNGRTKSKNSGFVYNGNEVYYVIPSNRYITANQGAMPITYNPENTRMDSFSPKFRRNGKLKSYEMTFTSKLPNQSSAPDDFRYLNDEEIEQTKQHRMNNQYNDPQDDFSNMNDEEIRQTKEYRLQHQFGKDGLEVTVTQRYGRMLSPEDWRTIAESSLSSMNGITSMTNMAEMNKLKSEILKQSTSDRIYDIDQTNDRGKWTENNGYFSPTEMIPTQYTGLNYGVINSPNYTRRGGQIMQDGGEQESDMINELIQQFGGDQEKIMQYLKQSGLDDEQITSIMSEIQSTVDDTSEGQFQDGGQNQQVGNEEEPEEATDEQKQQIIQLVEGLIQKFNGNIDEIRQFLVQQKLPQEQIEKVIEIVQYVIQQMQQQQAQQQQRQPQQQQQQAQQQQTQQQGQEGQPQ